MIIEGYRRMTPQQKLQRALDLNRAAESLARARIRRQYGPDLDEREENLRLASLYLDRETMRPVRYNVAASLDGFIAGPGGEFDWIPHDPAVDFQALFAEGVLLLSAGAPRTALELVDTRTYPAHIQPPGTGLRVERSCCP